MSAARQWESPLESEHTEQQRFQQAGPTYAGPYHRCYLLLRIVLDHDDPPHSSCPSKNRPNVVALLDERTVVPVLLVEVLVEVLVVERGE